MRAEYDIHILIFPLNFLNNVRLLGHAAAYGGKQLRLCPFCALQSADVPEYLFLCIFPDAAGVEKNQIAEASFVFARRLIWNQLIPHPLQHAGKLFGIVLVHLAAKRFNAGSRTDGPAGIEITHTLHVIILFFSFLLRDNSRRHLIYPSVRFFFRPSGEAGTKYSSPRWASGNAHPDPSAR